MRTIASAAKTTLAGSTPTLALMLELGFSPAVRLNSSTYTLQEGSNLYYGTGSLGAVEAVQDEAGSAGPLRFSLSGVPSESIGLALAEEPRGKTCTLRLAVLNPDTHAIEDTPVAWTGTLDQMPITHGASTCTIGVTAVHRGETYRRPKPLRYTDGDQQRLHPGDTSMRYVLSQAQVQDVWPAASLYRQG